MLLPCLLIGLLLVIEPTESNLYCSHRWNTESYYATAISTLTAINVNGPKTATDLLVKTSGGAGDDILISKALVSGIFDEDVKQTISNPTFCHQAGDVLHAADMDGDHQDDLLCQKGSDGSFSVRYYNFKDFLPEVNYAVGFACPSPHKLLIGDIDRDEASDLMCIDTTATNADGTPIHFSQSCHKQSHYESARSRPHIMKNSHWHSGMSVKNCREKSGVTFNLLPGALPSCDPTTDNVIMLDANGDGRMDVACHRATDGSVATFTSHGEKTGNIFTRRPSITQICPLLNHLLIAADIDGDGDDDLICVSDDVNTPIPKLIWYSKGNEYEMADPVVVDPCGPSICYDSGASADIVPSYVVGDFNNDGRDDLLCHYEDTTMFTQIVFSETYP